MIYKIENININYDKILLYKDFSIEFESEKITSILGRSGCGKTSLLKYIVSHFLNNKDIAYIFQEDNLIEWLNIYDNIDLVLKKKINLKKEREKIIDESLNLVGLKEYKRYYPKELSGGMRQRVNIARGIAYPAELLFMDEPFKSIDIINKTSIIQNLKTTINEKRKTIVMVSHDLDEVLEFSDHIICLGGAPTKITKKISMNKYISKELLVKYL